MSTENKSSKRGRPTVETSARQARLAARAARVAAGGEVKRGRPASQGSARQAKLAIKAAKLANIFPIEFKEKWSYHDNYYIFTGDRHHEVSLDFNGIKFYQIPAFSKAKSLWDDKMGHVCSKAEVTGFLIEFDNGMTNIFKQYL